MERHRQTIAEALKLAEETMYQHKPPEMNQTIDTRHLSPVVLAFVGKGQLKVAVEFKWKI